MHNAAIGAPSAPCVARDAATPYTLNMRFRGFGQSQNTETSLPSTPAAQPKEVSLKGASSGGDPEVVGGGIVGWCSVWGAQEDLWSGKRYDDPAFFSFGAQERESEETPEEIPEEVSSMPDGELWLLPDPGTLGNRGISSAIRANKDGTGLGEIDRILYAGEDLSEPISFDDVVAVDQEFGDWRKRIIAGWLCGKLGSSIEAALVERPAISRHCLLQLFAWLETQSPGQIDLAGVDLSRANLSGANLREANLSGANLDEAMLEGADLYKADLYQASMKGAQLSQAILIHARLEGSDLTGADLQQCTLNDAVLGGATLVGVNLHGSSMKGVDLNDAELKNANLEGVDLEYANLIGADLSGVSLRSARLDNVDLDGANLYRADLSGSTLKGAALLGANLVEARLENSDLQDADLTGANVTNTNLKNSNLDKAKTEGMVDW